MSKEKTVKDAIDYMYEHITSPMAGMVADLLYPELLKVLGEETLNKKVRAPK